MNIRNFVTVAAVATLLAASGTANAQILGGGATGGLGGSLSGGLGNVGGNVGGTLDGSLRGSTDAIGRTREFGSRAADRVHDTAADATDLAESTAADVEGLTSGAVDATSGAASDVTATGSAGGYVAGALEASTPEPVVKEEKPAKPKRKQKSQAKADGMADADGGLTSLDDKPVSGEANGSIDANASLEK